MADRDDDVNEMRCEVVTATEAERGERIDRFLVARVAGLTRSRIQSLIKGGHVRDGDGTISDAGHRVKPGEAYEIDVPPAEPALPAGEVIALAIAYEDNDLIVIDKPAGLVVHPAAGHATGTLVNALIAHCGASLSGIGGVKRPGIVHRLDKETSGLLVVAKTDKAHHGLSDQFAQHGADGRLERSYLALVWGVPLRRTGAIDARLGRSSTNRTKMTVVNGQRGRSAVTHYEVLETYGPPKEKPVAALVKLTLETGRTHQIRVHLAHIGHPVMGDPVYAAGFKTSGSLLDDRARTALAVLGRQALHAAVLGFEHPGSAKALSFESAMPADMASLRTALAAMSAPAAATAAGRRKTSLSNFGKQSRS